MKDADVVVCGAGLAGLAAAATAATAGAGVLLLDPHGPGGRAGTTQSDGFMLNAGPHALYRGGHAERVLAGLGVVVSGERVPVSGSASMLAGRVTDLPVWPAGLLRSRALGLRSKVAFARLMGGVGGTDPASVAGLTVREWCEARRLPSDAAAVVEAIARLSTYADAAAQQSADALFTQLNLGGVRYVHGGWQSIVDGLVHAVADAGAELVRARPEAVRPGRTGWHVDLADGSTVRATAVVLACGSPPAMGALADLPEEWIRRSGEPVKASCLDLGLRAAPPRRFVLGIDEPFYLSRHDPPARLAPVGHSLVSVAEYLAPGEQRDPGEGRRRLEDYARRCGIPDGGVVKSRYLHEMVVAHGMPTAAGGGMAGRPPVEIPGRPGLFAAGDWIGGDGLLADAALASGARAGELARSAAGAHTVCR